MHDCQAHSVCCKSSLYEQPKEFNDFQFYYFPFKPEKTQIKIFAFLNHFSTCVTRTRIGWQCISSCPFLKTFFKFSVKLSYLFTNSRSQKQISAIRHHFSQGYITQILGLKLLTDYSTLKSKWAMSWEKLSLEICEEVKLIQVYSATNAS